MKELNIMEATVLTSPNPLTLICSKKEDGSTNLAPICFVSYLSFNPPMVGFATGKQSHTGERVRETGKVIVETFRDKNPNQVPAVIVHSHGPFTWGKSAAEAVHNAVVLEEIAKMNFMTELINPNADNRTPQCMQDKHFLRKHGPNAYYGQKK